MKCKIHSAYYGICVFYLVFWSCGDIENRGIENKEVAREIRSREIKHITQAQITEAALHEGKIIADTAQVALVRKMQQAVNKAGILKAATSCDLQKLDPVVTLQNSYQVQLKRIRLQGIKKGQSLSPMETQLLDAYRYNVENTLALADNVQFEGSDYVLFTSPITLNNQVCLNCHGQAGKDISTEDLRRLNASYAMDSLTNYSINQPMAILSILFNKKDLIQRIEVE